VIKKPQTRRPRPDLGCTAIGWMDIFISIGMKYRNIKKFRYGIPAYIGPFRALIVPQNRLISLPSTYFTIHHS
jgi:hypothetical protein